MGSICATLLWLLQRVSANYLILFCGSGRLFVARLGKYLYINVAKIKMKRIHVFTSQDAPKGER